jgi:diacylglycerol kinase (ATP)
MMSQITLIYIAVYGSSLKNSQRDQKQLMSFIRRRILSTLRNSFEGLKDAWRMEEAFRAELLLAMICIPLAWLVGKSPGERLTLILSLVFVLIVELLNTAIEKSIDRISLEKNSLSKTVKDIGSAAVFLSISSAICIWAFFIFY